MLSINKLLGCHFLLVTPVMMAVLDNILLYTRRTHHGANKLSLFYSLFRHSNVGQIKHLHSRLSSLGRFRFFLALSTQSNDSAGNWDRVSIDGMEHMFFLFHSVFPNSVAWSWERYKIHNGALRLQYFLLFFFFFLNKHTRARNCL